MYPLCLVQYVRCELRTSTKDDAAAIRVLSTKDDGAAMCAIASCSRTALVAIHYIYFLPGHGLHLTYVHRKHVAHVNTHV